MSAYVSVSLSKLEGDVPARCPKCRERCISRFRHYEGGMLEYAEFLHGKRRSGFRRRPCRVRPRPIKRKES